MISNVAIDPRLVVEMGNRAPARRELVCGGQRAPDVVLQRLDFRGHPRERHALPFLNVAGLSLAASAPEILPPIGHGEDSVRALGSHRSALRQRTWGKEAHGEGAANRLLVVVLRIDDFCALVCERLGLFPVRVPGDGADVPFAGLEQHAGDGRTLRSRRAGDDDHFLGHPGGEAVDLLAWSAGCCRSGLIRI